MRLAIVTLLLLTGLFTGCHGTREAEKRYAIDGEVKGLDPAARLATIQHGKIGDWMEAMTMEFPVKPDADFQKLHVGDKVHAVVVVTDDKYYVTEVKVLATR
jgi:Cu/Ag efflux protein CusF